MTIDEAIRQLKFDKSLYETENCHSGDGTPDGDLILAIDLAIEAIREKAERDNPQPLALDEMNALDHEPIYVLHTGGKWTMNGWRIATASNYQNHGRCDLEIENGNTIIDLQNYGNTWLAYRHKPKEAAEAALKEQEEQK